MGDRNRRERVCRVDGVLSLSLRKTCSSSSVSDNCRPAP